MRCCEQAWQATGCSYLKLHVLDARRLSNRPVNTGHGRRRRNRSRVNDQVANLAPEQVSRAVAQHTTCLVLIRIDQTKSAIEASSGFDDWEAVRITDHLGIVVADDGGANHVCTGGEVDDCGCDGGGRAFSGCAAVAGSYGSIDGRSVIRHAVALSTEVLDVAKDLIGARIRIEGGNALVRYCLHPEIAGGALGDNVSRYLVRIEVDEAIHQL